MCLRNKKFQNNTGGWKQIEKEAWHGSVDQFMEYYDHSKQYKRAGVYIHKNITSGKCYVGQSRNVFNRVYEELHGKASNSGCKALYEAYRQGYRFEIILIFRKKGFPPLNKMERAYINMYDAMRKGYNRT
jgi:hypothetical protein